MTAAVLVLTLALLQAAATAVPDLRSAEQLLEQHQPKAALEVLDRVAPRDAHWHFLASRAWDALDDPAAAVREAEAALAGAPRDQRLYLHLGQIFLSRNTPAAALEVFSDAEKLFPAAFLIRLGKGLALKELERYTEAADVLEVCLRERPSLGVAFDALGTVYLNTRRFDDLLREGKKFRQAAPGDYRGPYYLASAYSALGDHEKAEPLVRESIRLQPGFAAAHLLLGKLLVAERRPEEAIPALEESVRLRPVYSPAYLHLARAYRSLGRTAESEAAMTKFEESKKKENAPVPALLYHRGPKQAAN